MTEENNKNDNKQFSFIQEQITSKKKSKLKRMIFSVLWTIVLGCIFGCVGALVFCLTQPKMCKMFGGEQDKKTVEFPVNSSEDEKTNVITISPKPTVVSGNTTTEEVNTSDKNQNTTDTSDETKEEKDCTESEEEKVTPAPGQSIEEYVKVYDDFKRLYYDVSESLVTVNSIRSGVDLFDNEYDEISSTSGLVVFNNDKELFILVSLDRIQNVKDIKVAFSDYLQVDADIQAIDSDLNLAVISISLEDIPENKRESIKPATFGESYTLTVGTPILALGSPNGYVGSMEQGMITSVGSYNYITDDKVDLFYTDIAYNEYGNGVIVNLKGEVVGIITNKLKGELNQEISTVIGISRISHTIEMMVNNTDRIYFGIKAADMTDSALERAEVVNGICVTEVEVNSPALEAGLQSGDIILSINDGPVMSVNGFHSIISICRPKETVKVKIRRNSKGTYKDMEMKVTLLKKLK